MNKKSLFATLVLSMTVVSVAFAGTWNGWIYQDPYPTSNTLLTTKFVTPQKGWVAGEKGTILYTEDEGDSWEVQVSGTDRDIKSIAFGNEKLGWAVGSNGLIIHTVDGGRIWNVQTSNTNKSLNKVFAVNDKEAWIIGSEGTVLHTINGGKIWEKPNTGISRNVASIHFINNKTGWLLAGDEVYGTQDGGKKWSRLSKLPIGKLPRSGKVGDQPDGDLILNMTGEELGDDWERGDIHFADEKNGWAVVGIWFLFHTQDGGRTWENQLTTGYMSYGLSHLAFADNDRGCAIGTSVLCTEDGESWTERLGIKPAGTKSIAGFPVIPRDITFLNNSIGWIVGNDGLIMKTENGGKTWEMESRRDECGSETFFIDKKTGWLYGYDSNHICRTDDGGYTWVKQDLGIMMGGLYFIDDSKGWAVGTLKEEAEGKQRFGVAPSGQVWSVIKHTTDGGKTWETQFKELISKKLTDYALFGVFFVNHSTGWAVGERGTILYTQDAGRHWEHQQGGKNIFYLRSILFVDTKTGWITGAQVSDGWTGLILYTEDGGKHWRVQKEISNVWLDEMFFIDKKVGWITGVDEGEHSSLLHTGDGGRTWEETQLGDVGFTYPALLNNSSGVISADKGWIFVTNDGGRSWNKIRKPIRKYPWHFSEALKGIRK